MTGKTTGILLCILMFSFSLLALTPTTDNDSELSENNDANDVILYSNQTNIPGFQEGSIFTDTTLSSGQLHTCAILDNGSVACWGSNLYGQLGNGGTTNSFTPTLTSSLGYGRTAIAISSGQSHTCAILDNGLVSCWGFNSHGQLGNGGGSQSSPTPTSSLGAGRTAVAISSGYEHTCVILDNGLVSCWGLGHNGRTGNGGGYSTSTPTLTSSLGADRTAIALSSGEGHTCAILNNGSVSCWGEGGLGQLGHGNTQGTTNRYTPTLTSSLGVGRTAVAISSGYGRTCAILDNGSVSCWGSGTNIGGMSENTPTLTSSLGVNRTAVAISSGDGYTCAILDNHSVSCWGVGTWGRLGNGYNTDKTMPTLTSSLGIGRTAVAISSGDRHTCSILDNGSVSCWGRGLQGQLGTGGTSDQNTPTLTSSLGTGRTVALSERDFDDNGILNIFQAPSTIVDDSEMTISSGQSHTCAITRGDLVSCWGYGIYGQLGNGRNISQSTPIPTSSLGVGRTAVAISSGSEHNCAILDNGSVSCWGTGQFGRIGIVGGTSGKNTPTLTSSLGAGRTAVAISSGNQHTCAILDNGSVSCWGRNNFGQIGIGGLNSYAYTPTLTSSLGVGRTAVAISSGNQHTCAILDNGSVSCWGRGFAGQLGNGGTSNQFTPTLTDSLGAGRTAVAISAGNEHTCVILDNGSVSCWGYGASGRLGNGGNSQKNIPILTSSLGIGRTAVAISSGGTNTCAILDNGSVSCWGSNLYGQLGNGGTNNQNTPTQTDSLGVGRTAVAISSGDSHTCAILDNGSVSCWGDGGGGRLGNGGTSNKFVPTLSSETKITSVELSSGKSHSCAILNGGSVSCWGEGGSGQLGDGFLHGSTHSKPTPISSLGVGRTAIAISSGSHHTCAILDNGLVSCWGDNLFGQIGNGESSSRYSIPTLTSSLGVGRTAVAISSGHLHTCVILDNGSISCWGEGANHRLGNGGTSDQFTPTLTSSLGVGRTAVAISSGIEHTCAILDNGLVSCWGYGQYGQLGNGTPQSSNTPTLTSSLGVGRTAVAISSGEFHTCAMLDNGSVSCWGSGGSGRLGSGVISTQFTPTLTSSLGVGRTAVAISSGFGHTCVILDNGSVSCWGYDSAGHLGNGGTSSQYTPTLTSSLGVGRTAVAISLGEDHTCAILDNGSVSCWGFGYAGRLGNGGTSSQSTPTLTSSLGLSYFFVDGDVDGDGFISTDSYPHNSQRSVSCSAGQHGRYICVDAPAGKYVPLNNSIYANDASAGYYVDTSLGTGQTTQTACLMGTYNPNTGSTNPSACLNASAGYYVDQTGQSSQTACPSGTYNPNNTSTSSSACIYASAGHYVIGIYTGQTNQIACAIGTYNPNNASTSSSACIYASAGYYVDSTLGTGQSSQTACSAGTYNPNTGSTSPSACIDASAGHYVDSTLGTGQPTQTACPIGTYNPNSGSTSPSACIGASTGYYVDQIGQSSQIACATGTYNPNNASTSPSACIHASAGYYVDSTLGTGQSNQTACSAGTYNPNTGSTSPSACIDASAGHYVDSTLGTGQPTQTACPIGTYNPNSGSTRASACIGASTGHYVGTVGQANQTACTAGTYQVSTAKSYCDDASAGHYVDQTGQSSQTACPIGTYNSNIGSTSSSACLNASEGHYVDSTLGTGQSSQTACPIGTYNPNTGSISPSACIDASAGYYVDSSLGIGQSSQTACSAGSYNPNTSSKSPSACADASAGHYVDQTGQSSQIACAPGTYQVATGKSFCDDASAGYYVDSSLGTGQTTQTACSVGTYNPNTGSTNPTVCRRASMGHYVAQTGQSSQTACTPGTYQVATGQSFCDEASPGHYVNQTGQSSQTVCTIGTYNPNTGSISSSACIDASSGYYVSQTNNSNQNPCLSGTYQPAEGSSTCKNADIGYYVNDVGSIEQKPCPYGTYQPAEGSSICKSADIGYYVDDIGSISQIPCPELKSTIRNSSTGESDCLRDNDSDLLPDIIDNDDDGDGFDDFDDQYPYDPYEWKDSDNDGEGDNSDPDDDNDGWSDVEELRQGTDPLDSSEQPVDGYEFIVPGTSISLGAWDLLGILGGFPLFVWISFGLLTRSDRNSKFEEKLNSITTLEELKKVSKKIDLSLTLRLLSVPQGIQLSKLKDNIEDKLEAPKSRDIKKIVPELSIPDAPPSSSTPAEKFDNEGYEWLRHTDGKDWYRIKGSKDDWIEFSN